MGPEAMKFKFISQPLTDRQLADLFAVNHRTKCAIDALSVACVVIILIIGKQQFGRQIRHDDDLPFGDDQSALNDIFQFPNVARP